VALIDLAVKAAPADTRLRQVRSMIYTKTHRETDALADLDVAVQLSPEDETSLRMRGFLQRHLGHKEEAYADLDEAWRINPLDIYAVSGRARGLRAAGRADEAISLWDPLVGWGASDAALNGRCWERAIDNRDLPKAEADCAIVVQREPKAAAFWDSYALVALRGGHFDEAIKRYDQALALEPKLAPSLYARGIARLRTGDKAHGEADIAAAKALDATSSDELTEAGITP